LIGTGKPCTEQNNKDKEGESMKKPFTPLHFVARASVVLALPAALILSQPLQLWARSAASGIVNGKTDKGYRYMSGGVGIEERSAMRKEAQGYDLDLAFADRAGHFLSDVNLTITDKQGNQIVDTTTAGPWFYIALPDGKYDVKASYDNQIEELKNLEVSKNHGTARLLHWQLGDEITSQG
jgi:hypothetical protein